jgi:hypothetical protein
MCGLLAVVAVMAIGRRLLGSWAWGLVAAATFDGDPDVAGLLMFDIKDVPAATGYTLVTWGLARCCSCNVRAGAAASVLSFALTAGLVLGIGARPDCGRAWR